MTTGNKISAVIALVCATLCGASLMALQVPSAPQGIEIGGWSPVEIFNALAAIVTGGGGLTAAWFSGLIGKLKERRSGDAMPVLESIKTLLDKFQPAIDDGRFSFVFKAGAKQYRCTVEELPVKPSGPVKGDVE